MRQIYPHEEELTMVAVGWKWSDFRGDVFTFKIKVPNSYRNSEFSFSKREARTGCKHHVCHLCTFSPIRNKKSDFKSNISLVLTFPQFFSAWPKHTGSIKSVYCHFHNMDIQKSKISSHAGPRCNLQHRPNINCNGYYGTTTALLLLQLRLLLLSNYWLLKVLSSKCASWNTQEKVQSDHTNIQKHKLYVDTFPFQYSPVESFLGVWVSSWMWLKNWPK